MSRSQCAAGIHVSIQDLPPHGSSWPLSWPHPPPFPPAPPPPHTFLFTVVISQRYTNGVTQCDLWVSRGGGDGSVFLLWALELLPHPQCPLPLSSSGQVGQGDTHCAREGWAQPAWGTRGTCLRGRGDELTWGVWSLALLLGAPGHGDHPLLVLPPGQAGAPDLKFSLSLDTASLSSVATTPRYVGPGSVGLVDTVLRNSFLGERDK